MFKKIIIFSSVLGAVLTVFFLKGALLIGRYAIIPSAQRCKDIDDAINGSTTISSNVTHEYIFTVIVYGILSILRFLEYVILGKQFHHFLFKQEVIKPPTGFFTKHSKRYFYLLLIIIILIPYFLLGIAIPSIGIYQELELSQQVMACSRHHAEVYIAYSAINYLRYVTAYTVRIMMLFTTLVLSKYWFPKHAGPPAHTSMGRSPINNPSPPIELLSRSINNPSPPIELLSRSINNPSPPIEVLSRSMGDIPSRSVIALSEQQPLINNSDVNNNSERETTLEMVLVDWKLVSKDCQERAKEYNNIGKQVEEIQELFQTWFIIPWVIYFIAASLKPYNILRPWQADEDGNDPINIPQIYYLLYSINQVITLLIPYLCAKKMNTYHRKYYNDMRRSQLDKFKDNPSRLSFARQLLIDKNPNYNFRPRILGTSIIINTGSPFYIVTLLMGIFLSLAESLLK